MLSKFKEKIQDRAFPITDLEHYVGGKWQPGVKDVNKKSHNPNDGSLLCETWVGKKNIVDAINLGVTCFEKISTTKLEHRIELLQKFRVLLADYQDLAVDILGIEAGKPKWEAEADLEATLNYLSWVEKNADKIMRELVAPASLFTNSTEFRLQPIGVASGYIPFSSPFTTFSYYFTASILAGSPILFVASSHAQLSSHLIARIFSEAEFPEGMVSVIFGGFESFKHTVANPDISTLLYTGSKEHCLDIKRDSKNKVGRQIVLQSGGKNAVIVHSSADLDLAVKCVTYGALKSAGQNCTSTSRVFVFRSQAAEFKERLAEAFRNIPLGRTDTPDSTPFMGPLYSGKAVDKFLRFQTMANQSTESILWGEPKESLSGPKGGGFFVSPSIHAASEFDNSNAYQGNVLFGPDVCLYEYDVLDQAIDKINTTDAAFAVSFIGDQNIISDRRSKFLAPNILINQPTVEVDVSLPLGGRLQSGHHRFHGPGVALYLCYPQAVSIDENRTKEYANWPWPK